MKTILIFGPHAEEYSLAKVNRGLALGLHKLIKENGLELEVKVSATLDQVAKLPGKEEFANYKGLEEIYEKFDSKKNYDLLIYNNFPKDPNALFGLKDINAKVKVSYIAWEEDRFPARWVDEFNKNLNAVFAASEHTKQVLKRSGVQLPIVVVSNALDSKYMDEGLIEKIRNNPSKIIQTNKKFVFFHNSSGLERKSPRELIQSFTEEFSDKDDVALFIKSTPSYNNMFPELIAEVRKQKNSPEIIYMEKHDLTEEEIMQIYLESSAYLSPSKAEGFNLPVLEAFQLGVPVITTGWSGHMDFANEENSLLVDYKLVPAKSHLDNPGAFWAEPDVDDLRKKMRSLYENDSIETTLRNAKKTSEEFSWERSAQKVLSLVDKMHSLNTAQEKKLAVISTYNTICGIAEYSSFLYPTLAGNFQKIQFLANKDATGRTHVDKENITRLWEYGETDFKELLEQLDKDFDLVHIQYSESFYTLNALANLINGLKDRGFPTILTAHALQVEGVPFPTIKKELGRLDQIHVLNEEDAQYLKDLGLKNVVHLPHGNITLSLQAKSHLRNKLGIDTSKRPILANHGFMSENKGILETLEAISLLHKDYPDLLYLAVNAVNPRNVTSQAMSDAFDAKVIEFGLQENVVHLDQFLEKEDIVLALSAADINIFAYPEFKQTASGAVRLAMAAGRPIIATDSFQLRDLGKFAYTIENNRPESIAQACKELLDSEERYFDYQLKVQSSAQQNTWDDIAISYLAQVAGLLV